MIQNAAVYHSTSGLGYGGQVNRRVLRGGAFSGRPSDVRSANRYNYRPEDRSYNSGFRPARTYP
jgi:formylglycine-generating enzyme required for sulfatase activity